MIRLTIFLPIIDDNLSSPFLSLSLCPSVPSILMFIFIYSLRMDQFYGHTSSINGNLQTLIPPQSLNYYRCYYYYCICLCYYRSNLVTIKHWRVWAWLKKKNGMLLLNSERFITMPGNNLNRKVCFSNDR